MTKSHQEQCTADLKQVHNLVQQLEGIQGDKTVATVLEPLNDLWMVIDRALNTASLYRNVHPDAAARKTAGQCEQKVEKLVTELGLSRPIHEAVAKVDVSGEDAVTQRWVVHLLRDFRRAGVDKNEATRSEIRKIKEELVELGQTFSQNIREDLRSIQLDSSEDLAGLPDDYIFAHKPRTDGKIVITTDYPDYVPFMTYAKNDSKRNELYKKFRRRGHPKNLSVLDALLAKRYQLAQLLGYESWAHYVTEDKMIKTADNARRFIAKISALAAPRATRDYNTLLVAWQKQVPGATHVGEWQKAFVEELVKRDRYQVDSQALREYFSYEQVRDGLFALTGKMFGITYRRVEMPVWHTSVESYEILDGDRVVGRFHLDMHPRDDKFKHAAAFPIESGVKDKRLPKATLVCNFATGLMEHDQVETFFHEFGHLLHHLLGGNHRWVAVSGFSTEWDFVEAPSQLLQEWAWSYDSLKTFAKNSKGETIPRDLADRNRVARDFGKGLWVAHQMFYASLSLGYYDRDPTGLDTTAMMRKLQDQYSLFEYVDDTYFQLSFGHLDHYSAIYYTYMWSLVIAKDMFSVFENKGMFSSDVAGRYRQFVLEPGGSKDANEMVRDFLQREYTFDSFADWLNTGTSG